MIDGETRTLVVIAPWDDRFREVEYWLGDVRMGRLPRTHPDHPGLHASEATIEGIGFDPVALTCREVRLTILFRKPSPPIDPPRTRPES